MHRSRIAVAYSAHATIDKLMLGSNARLHCYLQLQIAIFPQQTKTKDMQRVSMNARAISQHLRNAIYRACTVWKLWGGGEWVGGQGVCFSHKHFTKQSRFPPPLEYSSLHQFANLERAYQLLHSNVVTGADPGKTEGGGLEDRAH